MTTARAHGRFALVSGVLCGACAVVLAWLGGDLLLLLRGRAPASPEATRLLEVGLWGATLYLVGGSALCLGFAFLLRSSTLAARAVPRQLPDPPARHRFQETVLLLLVLGFLAFNLILSNRPFTYDERIQVVLDLESDVPSFRDVRFQPSAYLLSKASYLVAGRSEVALRMPMIFIAALGIALCAWLAYRLTGSPAASLWSAALLASHRLVLDSATSIRGYTLSWVGIAAWALLLLRSLDAETRGGPGRVTPIQIVTAVGLAGIISASHLFAAAQLALLLVAALWLAWRTGSRVVAVLGTYSCVGLMLGSLPWVANSWWFLGSQRAGDFNPASALTMVLGAFTGGQSDLLGGAIFVLLCISAGWAAAAHPPLRPLVAASVALPILALAFSLALQPSFLFPRFFISSIPLVLVGAAIGLTHRRPALRGAFLMTLVLSNLLGASRWLVDLADSRSAALRILEFARDCPEGLPIILPEDPYERAAIGFYLPAELSRTGTEAEWLRPRRPGSWLANSNRDPMPIQVQMVTNEGYALRRIDIGGGETPQNLWIPRSPACQDVPSGLR